MRVSVVAAGDGRPVAPKQGRVVLSEGDVAVHKVAHELREVALSVSDVTAGDGRPVATEQGRVTQSEDDVAQHSKQEVRSACVHSQRMLIKTCVPGFMKVNLPSCGC